MTADPPMTATLPCSACRTPIPVSGVAGIEVRTVCHRCGVVNLVNADGERGYRIRPGALEATIRQNGEG